MFRLIGQTFYLICWCLSNPVVQVVIIRYLVVQNIPALLASQVLIRVLPILACFMVIIIKVGLFKHPVLNSPNHLAQALPFSLGLIFISSVFSSIAMVLTIQSLEYSYVYAAKYIALYYVFETFFQSLLSHLFLKRQLHCRLMSMVIILLVLVYLIVCWFEIGQQLEPAQSSMFMFQETMNWRPVIFILFAALSNCLGHLIWKFNQFKQLIQTKEFNDLVSWANFIKDEPAKIHENLCIQNRILSRYFEAQLGCFHEKTKYREISLDKLTEEQIRVILASYFHENTFYSYQDMEPFYQKMKLEQDYVNFFSREGIHMKNMIANEDPTYYEQESDKLTLNIIISKIVLEMQLESQKYQELFSTDKYENFQFEFMFDEYTLDHEYIWKNTADTFSLNMFKLTFEALICFGVSFYQSEYQVLWDNGFILNPRVGYQMDQLSYYLVLGVLFGSLITIRPLALMRILNHIEPQRLYFVRMFSDLMVILLSFIWVQEQFQFRQDILGLIGLILAFLCQAFVSYMTQSQKELKEKQFYISFLNFLTQNQKFTQDEGQQMNTMLNKCAERMSLVQFLRVYSQVCLCRGIQSPDQLRHLKFVQPFLGLRDIYNSDNFLRKKLWSGGVPLIFSSNLRYENNKEHDEVEELVEHDDNGWNRIVLQGITLQPLSPINSGNKI